MSWLVVPSHGLRAKHVAPTLRLENGILFCGERRVDVDAIDGFYERYSIWTSRMWLEIGGAQWTIPMDSQYGEIRAWLRGTFPELPFRSDWMDGRFPTYSMGLPEAWSTSLITVLSSAVVLATTVYWGLSTGAYLLLAWFWILGQTRRRLVIQNTGIAAGPPWMPLVAWHRVERVSYSVGRTRAFIRYRSKHGGGECVVPLRLIPAIRGRLWRLGGLRLKESNATKTDRYLQWTGASWGVPWILLLSASTLVWMFNEPWKWLTLMVIAAVVLGLIGASVRARALGWAGGGVLWLTALYGVLLVLLSLFLGGWIQMTESMIRVLDFLN